MTGAAIGQRMAKIAEAIARHPWRVLFFALALSLAAGWATARLPVHTSRQALLPQDTDVAKRFNAFLQNFGAAADLIVVLEGAPREDLEGYANDLAARLQREPEVGQAAAKLDLGFFLDHAYLLTPAGALDQLAALPGRVPGGSLQANLDQALALAKDHPSLGGAEVDLQAAKQGLKLAAAALEEWRRWLSADRQPEAIDFAGLLADQGAGAMARGYFASRDGRMLFVFVHPKNPSEDIQSIGPFVDKIKAVSGQLAAERKAQGRPAPTVGLTGLPAIEYEEYHYIRKDIGFVVVASAALIAGLILLVVRSLRWAALIFVPMGLGVLWSLGLALVTVGHLTIITAAFIAILFGLGADYGIFTSSRIAEERRAGKPLVEAIGAGIGASFVAVLTAGGASLLIFGVLTTVDFPGFAELGVVAAKGVLMILISTWLVQPALYALLPPRLPEPAAKAAGSGLQGQYPKPAALLLVLLALGGAAFGTFKGLAIPFNYDVLAMLPADSQAAHYQRRMVAESDFQAEVVIYTAKDMAEARRITEQAGKLPSIAQAQSLANLFPEDAGPRLAKAQGIAEAFAKAGFARQLADWKAAGISPQAFASLQALLASSLDLIDEAQEQAFSSGHADLVDGLEQVRGGLAALQTALAAPGEQPRARTEAFFRALLAGAESGLRTIDGWKQAQPLSPAGLPATLHDRFFGADGSIAVYAFPAKTVYDPANLDQLIQEVYRVSPNATGFPTTHQAFAKAVVESFSRGTVLALAGCLLWIVLATRSVLGFALASLPLLIGGGWMLGLMALGGIQYNYANIVALPLVIALAVDYGVWFAYRWGELRGHSPFAISLNAGKVIALAAGTELAGLGAVTLASYRGVSSLGLSITIGLLCCLGATFFIAPAIGQLLDSTRKQP